MAPKKDASWVKNHCNLETKKASGKCAWECKACGKECSSQNRLIEHLAHKRGNIGVCTKTRMGSDLQKTAAAHLEAVDHAAGQKRKRDAETAAATGQTDGQTFLDTFFLRFVDGQQCGISKIYLRMSMLQTWVKAMEADSDAVADIQEAMESMATAENRVLTDFDKHIPDMTLDPEATKEMMCCILKRWELLHSAVHSFTYVTDPEFHGHIKSRNDEVDEGFKKVLKTVLKDRPRRTDGNGITKSAEAWAMAQWADYQMKRNVFASSNKAMWDDARSTSPHDWWFTWASRAPELQYVCMRMHSVAMSTGAMERAWSSYDFVHSIRRNRLSPSRADKLVFIYNNMRNMRKLAKLAALNKRDPGVPWTWLIGDDDDDVDVDPEPSDGEDDEAEAAQPGPEAQPNVQVIDATGDE